MGQPSIGRSVRQETEFKLTRSLNPQCNLSRDPSWQTETVIKGGHTLRCRNKHFGDQDLRLKGLFACGYILLSRSSLLSTIHQWRERLNGSLSTGNRTLAQSVHWACESRLGQDPRHAWYQFNSSAGNPVEISTRLPATYLVALGHGLRLEQ